MGTAGAGPAFKGGFTPLPAPALRNDTEGVASVRPPVDDALAAAEEEDRRRRLLLGFSRAGERIGAAFAGVAPQYDTEEMLSTLPGAAETLLAGRNRAAASAEQQRKARLSDPNSPESRRFQMAVGAVMPGVVPGTALPYVAAADEDLLFKGLAFNEAAAKRKAAEEARKERELLAKEAKDKATQDKATQQNLDREGEFRREVLGNPVVKEYQLALIGYDKMRRAASDPSAAGDLAMVFGFMKTLDPTSVVKETEFANAQNATNVPDRIRNVWNRVLTGERLNPEQRAEFLRVAASQMGASKSRADAVMKSYSGMAAGLGLDPSRVVLGGLSPDVDFSAPPPTTSGGAGNPAQSQQPRQLADVPVLYPREIPAGKRARDVIPEGEMRRIPMGGGKMKLVKKVNGGLVVIE